MIRPFKFIFGVFKSYSYADLVVSLLAVMAILLMIVKLIVFPYGLFGFGKSNIYTEGLIARNGIQNLNPVFVQYNEADREVSRLIFSGLMKYDPETKAIVDDMANLTINEGKTEYVFELREGLKWHDGEDVTVEDVMFTFNDIVLADGFPNQILKTNFSGVLIEQLDDRNIKFTLDKPNIFFVTNLTTGILPKHILQDVDPADLLFDDFNKMPLGTGPYRVNEPVEYFQDGRTQVTLERNPYYYGDIATEIEFMRFLTYPGFASLSEEVNAMNGIVKLSYQDLLEFQNSAANERFELVPYELPQYSAIFMNMESEVLKGNQGVRLALQKAVNKEELIELLGGRSQVDTPLLELNQEDWLLQHSIEQAQGALKDAGYNYHEEDIEKSGIRYDEDGEALEVNLIVPLYEEGGDLFEEVQQVVEFLQAAWERIGVNVIVELLYPEEFEIRVMNRQYDLVLLGQSLGYNLDTYSYWHSTQADPGGQNFSNYKSFQVDSLIEDIRAVFNQDKRERQLNELAERIKDDVPAIFLYRPIYYYASDGKVSGISMEGVVFPSDRFATMFNWVFER